MIDGQFCYNCEILQKDFDLRTVNMDCLLLNIKNYLNQVKMMKLIERYAKNHSQKRHVC